MKKSLLSAVVFAGMLAGCAQAPLSPTVVAMPGPGKSPADLAADEAACRQVAAAAVAGQVQAANNNALAGAVTGALTSTDTAANTAATTASNATQAGAAAQVTLQGQYDADYSNCIVTHGDLLPGMAPPPEPPPPPEATGPVSDPLVRHVQSQLIRLGYLAGGADGVAGPKTAAAISKFEQDHGMTVDGVSSHALLKTLRAQAGGGGGGWAAPPPPSSN